MCPLPPTRGIPNRAPDRLAAGDGVLPAVAVRGGRFGDFEVLEVLYRGAFSTVLRCLQDGHPLVVKVLLREVLQAVDVARFRREYELSRRVTHAGVVSALALGSHAGALYLTMPDDGAVALREMLRDGPLAPDDALHVALAMVDALEAVHAEGILHKDVAPGNVVADLRRGVVRLIDFGIAAEISVERPALAPVQDIEGTLAYAAPEQSGRMNRDVDYRADFYALGATLFEMLAGVPPFAATDPGELLHAHLASPPRRLADVRPDLPPLLGALVGRLLAKEPEARYQSHQALRRDLRHLRAHLHDSRVLQDWVLARGDLAERFQVSGRLYGRDREVAHLRAAFDAACAGAARVVLLGGFSGIGKTALVHELQRALLGSHGEMVAGKFHQFGPHAPCAGFVQALRQRGRQVLALHADQQQAWRDALRAQLGPNAALATAAVPELALLLGHAPEPVELAPAEAENRFLRTMQRCFASLASAEHPLVLFIDDLQWADRVSRRLLRELALDEGLRHLLVVGTYRSNEVVPGHPLVDDLAALGDAGGRLSTVDVGPLALADVVALLADTLHRSPDEVAELARLCHDKTGANPFFLGRFLQDLHRRQLIALDRSGPRWVWSIERIRHERLADNVVALMLEQLQRLPQDTRSLLTTAACLGVRFALQTLATASYQPEDAVLKALAPALATGLLAPADARYKWVAVLQPEERRDLQVELAFAHDRVQEAAYLLAAPEQRPALHLHIGRMLRAEMDPQQPVFAVVEHLNHGVPLMADAVERTELARWNARLSEVARDAASFDLAADHALQAVALHGEGQWDADREGALALRVHAARMAALKGDPGTMDALLRTVSQQALRPQERARLLEVRIEESYASGQLGQTLDMGLEALALLGVQPPTAPELADALRLVAQVRSEIEAIGLETLAQRAPMADALYLQQMDVIARMTAAAYIARPALLPWLTVLQMRLMMAHGHAPVALSAYSVMGLMVAELLGDYRFGYRLGRLSMALVERHGWLQVQAHAGFSFNAFLQHWVEPLADGLPALLEVHRNGLEYGNLRHAGLALYLHGCHAFLGGMPLAELVPLLERHAAALRRIRQPVAHDYLRVLRETVRALQHDSWTELPLESADFSALALEQAYAGRADQTGALFLHALRCMLHALAGRHAEAVRAGEAAAAFFSAGRGMAMVPFCVFFTASSALALVRRGARADDAWRPAVEAAIARFERWVLTNSDLVPLWRLLRAGRAAADGDVLLARTESDAALEAALARGNLLLRALVHAHRARTLDEADPLGLDGAAAAERAEARTVLLRWGARAPCRTLDVALPESRSLAGSVGSHALDLSTLMKAVQAVTAEIALGPLLDRMLEVLLQNAGARRAVVVLREGDPLGGGWEVLADSGRPRDQGGLASMPLEQAGDRLPLEVLRTVLATANTVLVHDLEHEPAWRRLPYFSRRPGRSLLCLPMVRQGRAVGALYLENDAVGGAFSPQRIEFLELLLGSVVNAIDNARLYGELRGLADTLEQRVAERTRELRESEARMLGILRNVPLPVVVTRRVDAVFVYVNERAAALAGMAADALVERLPWSMYRHAEDRDKMLAVYHRDGQLRDYEVCLRGGDGRDIWALISMVPIVYDGEVADLATIVDITGRKSAEDALRRVAATDHLTGLSSRGQFLQSAQEALARAQRYGLPLSLVMLDIDHFKQVNDRHGHALGDEALRAVAQVCMSMLRGQDRVGRLGGEEYCLLLPDTDAPAAEAAAERLRDAIAQLRLATPTGQQLVLTASFGVSVLHFGDTLDSMLARADAGLYAAKHAGRNRVSGAGGPPTGG